MSIKCVGCLNHNLQHDIGVKIDSATAVHSVLLPEPANNTS